MSRLPTVGDPAITVVSTVSGTRATTDHELVASWVEGLTSAHSRRNFEATALRFLVACPPKTSPS